MARVVLRSRYYTPHNTSKATRLAATAYAERKGDNQPASPSQHWAGNFGTDPRV